MAPSGIWLGPPSVFFQELLAVECFLVEALGKIPLGIITVTRFTVEV